MLGIEYVADTFRIATVIVPVAVYFLILGILNTRRHPQLLTCRRDFALMAGALSPMFAIPLLGLVGATALTAAAIFAGLLGLVVLLLPRHTGWVIYNLSASQARKIIASVLASLNADYREVADGFELPASSTRIRVSGFSLLRNVSIRLEGTSPEFAKPFGAALHRAVAASPAESTPMATAMLLIATAMLLAPLTLVARRVPEIVRVLTDLLP